jgi:DNA-binding response OmpR family regulator
MRGAAPAAPRRPLRPSLAITGAAEPRVLVIDDDPEARDLTGRFLTKEGYCVATAVDGAEGLVKARAMHPDLITLDVMMTDIDGWSVLAELKADPTVEHIPVVLLTMADDRTLGYALGASDYFTKPVAWDHLAESLRNLLPTGAAPTPRRSLAIRAE